MAWPDSRSAAGSRILQSTAFMSTDVAIISFPLFSPHPKVFLQSAYEQRIRCSPIRHLPESELLSLPFVSGTQTVASSQYAVPTA
jgi:hypothetical protein